MLDSIHICKKCNQKTLYNEKYDADYCDKCDEWIDKECNDLMCSYCISRPSKPSRVKVKK